MNDMLTFMQTYIHVQACMHARQIGTLHAGVEPKQKQSPTNALCNKADAQASARLKRLQPQKAVPDTDIWELA